MAIGRIIRRERKKLGWSQDELSRRMGIKQPNFVRLEKDDYLPSLATLQKVAEAMGKDVIVYFRQKKP